MSSYFKTFTPQRPGLETKYALICFQELKQEMSQSRGPLAPHKRHSHWPPRPRLSAPQCGAACHSCRFFAGSETCSWPIAPESMLISSVALEAMQRSSAESTPRPRFSVLSVISCLRDVFELPVTSVAAVLSRSFFSFFGRAPLQIVVPDTNFIMAVYKSAWSSELCSWNS